jgi:hypothetical protein
MDMSVNAQGMEIPVEMVQLTGGKMYVKINLQGKEITQMASDEKIILNTMTMKAERMLKQLQNVFFKYNDFQMHC